MCQIRGAYNRCICGSNDGDLSALPPLSFLCDLTSPTPTQKGGDSVLHGGSLLCHGPRDPCGGTSLRSDDGGLESDGTSCGLSDPWEDVSSTGGGEIYSTGGDAPYALHDNANLSTSIDESRRFSERNYFPHSSTTSGQNSPHLLVHQSSTPSPSHHHKKKRRHRQRRSNKDGGTLSSSPSRRDRPSPAPSSSPHSEDEDVTIVANLENKAVLNHNSLSSLLDHNEPAVACDRGSWGAGLHEYAHRSVQLNPYGRYAEDSEVSSTTDAVSNSVPWSRYAEESPREDFSTDSYSYRYNKTAPSPSSSTSSSFMRTVTGKAALSTLHKNISSLRKKIKRFEEEFEENNGYKPSHSDKMKHKDIKKYMSDLNKYRKEMKMLKEGVADLMSTKGFSLSLLRCQESTTSSTSSLHHLDSLPSSTSQSPPLSPSSASSATIEHHQNTLLKVEDKLREARGKDGRPTELSSMSMSEMQEEKTSLQKALLYYESVHGRPSTREIKELARPLYDRYRQVKRNVTRAQSRAKENLNELAPIIEHVAMDFTLASPQHRSSLVPGGEPMTELLQVTQQRLLEVKRERERQEEEEEEDPEEGENLAQEGYQSDSSDMSKKSGSNNNNATTALSNLHSLPLHELKERRKEAKDLKKKLRRSLRQYEEKYEREHGQKLAKEDRGPMENTYGEYKHAKAKLRLLEALISKKAPKEYEF